ncbi:MAG: hemolysin family protein, partial [Candidatus Babeliales bacterium]
MNETVATTSATTLYAPIFFFCITLSLRALLSFLETSIAALRLFKLKELAANVKRYSSFFQVLEKAPHQVLITILVASNLADVTTAALATYITETIFAQFNFSGTVGFSLGIGFATVAILIFGEILPKNIAKTHGDRIFQSTLWITSTLYYLFYPLVNLLIRFSNYIVILCTGHEDIAEGSEWVASEKEIKFLIDYISQKGLLETEKSTMLQNIFDLGHTPIRDIMVPSADIIKTEINAPIEEIISLFSKHRFTRIPIYKDTIDNIVGMIHLKDVFTFLSSKNPIKIKELLRPILFIPESLKVNQLLRKFREQKMHIAMVLNEYGTITGLITLEDVLEEIVGDISDEHELTTQNIVLLRKGRWLVNASTPLEEIEQLLSITFVKEAAITLGGFLTEKLQRLPKKGEFIVYNEHHFQVQK